MTFLSRSFNGKDQFPAAKNRHRRENDLLLHLSGTRAADYHWRRSRLLEILTRHPVADDVASLSATASTLRSWRGATA